MKRPIAVGVMVGILLAASTAAFATPVKWESTITTPGLPITEPYSEPIEWFQAYTPYDAAHPGSSKDDLILTDVAHRPMLIIESSDVKPSGQTGDELDLVYRDLVYLGRLNQDGQGPTVFYLSGTNTWLRGTTGFDVMVDLDGRTSGYYPTTIKKATLVVWTDWTEPPKPPEPPEPPVVPAPGAVLLVSLGAGLVSLLRTRKVL